jgi:5-methylcytosine-specific restriction endonuclease McrA
MKVLRRFPGLADALRDGRLCLSTLALLGQVLTGENAEELVARAAWRTTAEVDHLVASLKPRQAPREGIRKLPGPATVEPAGTAGEAASPVNAPPSLATPQALTLPVSASAPAEFSVPGPLGANRPRTAEMRAVSEGQWSLRATIDRACKDDLETLTMLLSHKVPRGDLAAVLHEAIRCGLEKHGKRKGAVKPARKVAPKAVPSKNPAAIPAEVRRQVWERDGGRCAWTGPDGKRCGSRWQLEVDHVDPVARGGTSTLSTLRLACRGHNLLYAEQVYGREFMQKYRKGESAIDGGSGGAGRARREAHIAG